MEGSAELVSLTVKGAGGLEEGRRSVVSKDMSHFQDF